MDLSTAQRRTLEQLIGLGPPPPLDAGLAGHVRAGLEAALAEGGIEPGQEPIWLGKHRLNDYQRCQGLFQAGILGEGPGFEHSARTAAGALFHKAIEIDVSTDRGFDPHSVCERAALRSAEADGSFGRFWTGMDGLDRAEVMADAGRHLSLFRDSFPPLSRRWASQPELRVKALLAGGAVVLSGTADLVLGRTRRLVLDFKTGRAWPEHPEDMRFYALLLLLRTGVPPYRVATFFLDSGEWQAEDVDQEMLGRAAARVTASALSVHAMRAGASPALVPGVHCGWCPRRPSCPAAIARFDGGGNGESSSSERLLPNGRLSYRSVIPRAPTSPRGATAGRKDDDAGHQADPPTGRGPPQDVRAGRPA